MKVNTTAIISATTTDNQIPFSFHINGSKSTAPIWKTRVLKKEIKALVNPSFKAVKKLDPYIANPIKGKQIAKILNPFVVISIKVSL